MRPPIPPPTGDLNLPAKVNRAPPSEGVFVYFRLNLGHALRKSTKATFSEPGNILTIIIVSGILASMLWPPYLRIITPFETWVLSLFGFCLVCVLIAVTIALFSTKPKESVVLMRYGILRIEGKKETEIEWSRVLYVLNWSGDLLLCTFAGSTFIPRDAFASSQECREFLRIARELRKSRGATWRDEWDGKTFGHNS